MEGFSLAPLDALRLQTVNELRACNDVTLGFGLYLSERQMQNIAQRRWETLIDMGRVELGEGLLTMLVLSFCDSPFIDQNNYEDTLIALVDLFYAFKAESMERLADDELIAFMKERFDGVCQGSLTCLYDSVLWGLCHEDKDDG